MYRAYSNAESCEADRKTIASGVNSLDLMERAGNALFLKVVSAMEKIGADEALFVLGGGNNAGDGFVAARKLSERSVKVSALCLENRFSDDCKEMRSRYRGEILTSIPKKKFPLIVDCVFGTGLKRPPEGDYAELISFINGSGAYVISCDLPSGLTENGKAYSPCVVADETLSIGGMKSALLLREGADHAGIVSVAEIGIAYGDRGAEVWEDTDVKGFFPKKKSCVNKGSFGKCNILSAGERIGAAMLSASAALRSGAGYTSLYVPEHLLPAVATALPSCVVERFQGADGVVLSSDALAVGMGFGATKELYSLLTRLLSDYRGTLVLDADALTVLARFGVQALKTKTCNVILTPHPKEFSRLCGLGVEEVLDNAVSLAQEFASRYGVTLILKNNRSIITDGKRTAINCTGSPALAKCGSGDVLAGFLAGTCVRGLSPFDAACTACYVFGRAGEFAEEKFGQYAPDSSDIVELLLRAVMSVSE